jgi:hypothetical protein
MTGSASGRIGWPTAIHKGTGVSGILEDFIDRRRGGFLPQQRSAVKPAGLPPREQEVMLFEITQYLLTATPFHKLGEHPLDSLTDLPIGVFLDTLIRQPHQASRQMLYILPAVDPT